MGTEKQVLAILRCSLILECALNRSSNAVVVEHLSPQMDLLALLLPLLTPCPHLNRPYYLWAQLAKTWHFTFADTCLLIIITSMKEGHRHAYTHFFKSKFKACAFDVHSC